MNRLDPNYRAMHVPPNDIRAAMPVAGDYYISFTSLRIPAAEQRSRDPVEGKDGAIW